jgi:hypothetical protein
MGVNFPAQFGGTTQVVVIRLKPGDSEYRLDGHNRFSIRRFDIPACFSDR